MCFLYAMSFCQGVSIFCELTAHLLAQCPVTGRMSCSILFTQRCLTSGPCPPHTRAHHFVQLPFAAILKDSVTYNVFIWPCHWLMAFCYSVMPPVVSDRVKIGHQDKLPCLSALEWCCVITILLSLNILGCNVVLADALWQGGDISGKVMTCDWLPIWTTNVYKEKNAHL